MTEVQFKEKTIGDKNSDSPLSCLVEFFFVGAPKAGSTSAFELLTSSPDIFRPPVKEPTFFCTDFLNERPNVVIGRPQDFDSYLRRGKKVPHHMCFPDSIIEYQKIYDDAHGLITCDFSTFNFASQEAPQNICAYNPDASIIIFARKPVARIMSHFTMDRTYGYTDKSLKDELEDELFLGKEASWSNCRLYIRQTDYKACYERFRNFFPKEKIHIVVAEEFQDPNGVAREELFNFMDATNPPAPLVPNVNERLDVRYKTLGGLLKSKNALYLRKYLNSRLPSSIRSALRKSLYTTKIAEVKEPEVTANKICESIEIGTEQILGREIEKWRI